MVRRGLLIALLGVGSMMSAAASADAAILDANCPGPPNGNTGVTRMTQTFTAQRTGGIVRGQMFLNKDAGPPFVMEIYATASGAPTGSPIGSTTIPDNRIPNGVETPITGTFRNLATRVPVTAGSVYAISVNRPDGSFIGRDRTGNPCSGNEYSLTGPTWGIVNPEHDFPFEILLEPSSDVTISQVGRALTVKVPNDGTLDLLGVPRVVAIGKGAASAKKKKRKTASRVLVASVSQAPALGPGDVVLPLNLTPAGAKIFKRKGKLTSAVTVTYTPTGGRREETRVAVSFTAAKKKKKKKKG